MAIQAPCYLLLFTLLPALVYYGWPSGGPGRARSFFSLLIRCCLVSLLILALAGLSITAVADQLSVVFLLDHSDSIPLEAREVGYEQIRRSVAAMGPDDRAGLIVFGREPRVERAVSTVRDWGALTTSVFPQETDLAEAIQLAQAILPTGGARRIVLFGDGRETTGDALEAARQARAAGIDLLWAGEFSPEIPEVSILSVHTPEDLTAGEQFDLDFTIQSTILTSATVRVFSNREMVVERTLQISPGELTYSLPLIAGAPGFSQFRVQIETPLDTYFQNNDLAAFSKIAGPPQVLIVAPQTESASLEPGRLPNEQAFLAAALQSTGYQVEIVQPAGLPSDLEELVRYDTILLINTPAQELSTSQLQGLMVYTRDIGGGLIAIGGPTSFGVGGYYKTALEEILPVEMRITDPSRKPPVTIVFILDRSGSMSGVSGDVSKIELAKEAVNRSVELMFPEDQVGVIAFNETAQWIVPITALDVPEEIIQAVGGIRPDGGTDILAGIEAAASALPDIDSPVKHIILLTDGGADPAGIPALVADLRENQNITFSAVGIGEDAAAFLPDLAEPGGGRYHFAPSPAEIPSIFTQETSIVSRNYLVEETFQPLQRTPSPLIDPNRELPPLFGYVATTPKNAATIILSSPQGDPILAVWQYGLGKTVAFTSDATSRWAQDWVSWEGFPVFWSQIVRGLLKVQAGSNLETSIQQTDERVKISVDATGDQGEFLNGLSVTAVVVSPDQQSQNLMLPQVAPGLYEGSFIPDERGSYLLTLLATWVDPAGETFTETIGWVQAYGKEYRFDTGAEDPSLPLSSSGVFQISQTRDDFFRHNLAAPARKEPTGQLLLTIAAALLPFDIALRRLTISRSDLKKWWNKVSRRMATPDKETGDKRSPTPQLQALMAARTRVFGPAEQQTSENQLNATPAPARSDSGNTNESANPPPPTDQAPEKSPGADENKDEESLAAILLARRIKRKNDQS